ncbi:MAG: rod shape-determining protein MreC [Chlamydiales bacterium]|nr:rod shape-determining protein MreC [Chlamydiales bacterium]
MRKINYRPYLLLAGFFFIVLICPETAAERMRHVAVSSIAPSWRLLTFLKGFSLQLLMITPPGGRAGSAELSAENDALKQENLTLRTQLANVRQWLLQEERVDEQLQRWKELSHSQEVSPELKEFYKRRASHLKDGLDLQLRALPARVIFREPTSWSSFLWLNVGERDNNALKKKIVAKNSPVVIGTSLVGVVEEVSYKQCKVRLITDARLIPSVRAVRGKEQNRFLREHLEGLLLGLGTRSDLFATQGDAQGVISLLSKLHDHLGSDSDDQFLAKGELYGTSMPLWRSRDLVLRGVGFNYDYADAEGPSRDLRTGESKGEKKNPAQVVKVGDLLVTTGMDGIFPAGLRVAVVSEVTALKEGACSYDIEAKATCGNLNRLLHLTVLPPLETESSSAGGIPFDKISQRG